MALSAMHVSYASRGVVHHVQGLCCQTFLVIILPQEPGAPLASSNLCTRSQLTPK